MNLHDANSGSNTTTKCITIVRNAKLVAQKTKKEKENVKDQENERERGQMSKTNFDVCEYTKNGQQEVLPHDRQVATINQLFFGENGDVHVFYSALISKKCAGYKQQDVANNIYDQRWFVTRDEVIELLVASKLKCYYCRRPCYIHYSESFCHEQWTLERLSNDQGHNRANVVISCLKCNLNRGTKSSDKFKMGKQIRFTKTF
jgi:hypothetical protein